ncbi:cell division cycle-associated protein 4 isoform X1 [Tachysurus ichikawai]
MKGKDTSVCRLDVDCVLNNEVGPDQRDAFSSASNKYRTPGQTAQYEKLKMPVSKYLRLVHRDGEVTNFPSHRSDSLLSLTVYHLCLY